jgi:hypothetical protein
MADPFVPEIVLVHGVVEELGLLLGSDTRSVLPLVRWQAEKWLAELRLVEALLVLEQEMGGAGMEE